MWGVMGRWECQETFSTSRGAQLDAIYIDNALFYYVTLLTLLTLFTWTWDARTRLAFLHSDTIYCHTWRG